MTSITTTLKQIAVTATLAACCSLAAHADTFSFSFASTSGPAVHGAGTLTGTPDAYTAGAFDLTSAIGSINGVAITLVSSPGADSQHNVLDPSGLYFFDNVLYTTGNSVDNGGLLFKDTNSQLLNLFYDNGYVVIPQNSYPNETPVSLQVAPTPEPSSILMLGTGLLSTAGFMRRRFKQIS